MRERSLQARRWQPDDRGGQKVGDREEGYGKLSKKNYGKGNTYKEEINKMLYI